MVCHQLIFWGKKKSNNTLKNDALKLLARREHSSFELYRKLARKGYADLDIGSLLEVFKKQGWQDDARFASAYTGSRQARGYGPLLIQKELSERGISDAMIVQVIDQHDPVWVETLVRLVNKKFAGSFAEDFIERAKQFRFLQSKGFPLWLIKKSLKEWPL